MFQKVLIAEDTDFILSGIKSALQSLKIPIIEYARSCDDAFLKLESACSKGEPFDLLVSDLSFIENPNIEKLHSGEDLIAKAKKLQKSLKTIVFSVEEKPYRIQQLCNVLRVDAFVCKSVNGEAELKKAVQLVFDESFFISPKLGNVLIEKDIFKVTAYDLTILKYLADGLDQKEICGTLRTNKVKPNSISSVEKRLKQLKEKFNANNPTQLVAVTKDFGLI
ncbi:response regulator [Tenacibaculum pacificus]|uniref:response regulator n=1 Tax=Tenacibaculum TaxID=104267 RepID=UPI0022F3CF66|nr:response regulator [Tenacibaculum pacificus]WBX72533.1 response regulator [Tenacibaculum pacificus]